MTDIKYNRIAKIALINKEIDIIYEILDFYDYEGDGEDSDLSYHLQRIKKKIEKATKNIEVKNG